MLRSLCAAAALGGVCGALALGLSPAREESPPAPAAPPRVLPGVRAGGEVQLPNQWSLRPAGKQLPLGDFPVNLALHPGGQWLAVLHAGYGEHEVVVVDCSRTSREDRQPRQPVDQTFYGLCFAPDGKTLYASGGEFEVVHAFAFDDGLLSDHREIAVAAGRRQVRPRRRGRRRAGRTLFAAGTWGDAVAVVPLDDPDRSPHRRAWKRTAIPTPACPTPRATGCSSACGARPASPSSTWRRRRSRPPGRRNRIRPRWPWRPTARRCSSPAPTRRKVSVLDTADAAKTWKRCTAPSTPTPRRATRPTAWP